MRRLPDFLFLVLPFICLVGDAWASPPEEVDIARSLQDLADLDPEVRDQARVELMGIDPNRLEELRVAVEAARPLQPAQADLLPDVVMHVYARSLAYKKDLYRGFLGISWPATLQEDQIGALIVRQRLPGFCAYRFLQDGDVILRVNEPVSGDLTRPEDIRNVVTRCAPGDTVQLEVLRGGRVRVLDIVLDAMPIEAADRVAGGPEVLDARRRAAREYWDTHFSTIVSEDLSSVLSTAPEVPKISG